MKDERDPKMSLAIKIIDEHIQHIRETSERDIEELIRAKEALLKLPKNNDGRKIVHKNNGHNGHVAVVHAKGSWQNIRLRDAISLILTNVDGPVSFKALMQELQQRGVRLGDPEKPQRFVANLKTAIVNNKKKFRYDKRTNQVSLREVVSESEPTERVEAASA